MAKKKMIRVYYVTFKERYLKLRAKLIAKGTTFTAWARKNEEKELATKE